MKNKANEENHMKTSSFVVNRVLMESDKRFAEVTKSFKQQLGKFDPGIFESLSVGPQNAEEVKLEIEKMIGKSGLMLFGAVIHGPLLSIFGKNRKAIQYVIGNPLIAIQMTQHNLAAGLYAPFCEY